MELNDEVIEEVTEILESAPHIVEAIIMSPDASFMSVWMLLAFVFALTFFIEETAIAASAYLVGTERLTLYSGFLALYAGIFVSDLFLYALGAGIRRVKWIGLYFNVSAYQAMVSRWLDRSLLTTIVVARLIPGMLIPIFIVLGFSRTNIYKISILNAMVTAIYTAVVLFILLSLGIKLGDLIEVETVAVFLVLWVTYLYRLSIWRCIKKTFYKWSYQIERTWKVSTHPGMPDLTTPRHLTLFENLPNLLIYTPIVVAYFFNALKFRSLSAPKAANPGLTNAGICGESKADILAELARICPDHVPNGIVVITCTQEDFETRLHYQIEEAGLRFPFIAKPDVGYMSQGVELIKNMHQLMRYLAYLPKGQRIILQEYFSLDGEAGIFYACVPGGKPLVRVALTYPPFVIGDGVSTVKELLWRDPRFVYFYDAIQIGRIGKITPGLGEKFTLKITGSTSDGTQHVNYPVAEDSPLVRKIVEISQSFDGFWLGRYDVKFENLTKLINGDFKIIELNGAAGEDLTAWDPRNSVRECYRILFQQLRLLFEIGAINQKQGFVPVRWRRLFRDYLRQESVLFRIVSALSDRRDGI